MMDESLSDSPRDQRSKASAPSNRKINPIQDSDDETFQAFHNRPHFSIRMQIYYCLFFSFLVILCIAIAQISTMNMVGNKIYFLEAANNYLFEIQQARRFEKNFFLYGTNISDALESAHRAKNFLEGESDQLKKIMEPDSYNIMIPHLDQYTNLLENLAKLELHSTSSEEKDDREKTELEIRRHGQEMFTFAQDLMQKEKQALENMIALSRNVHTLSLLLLFLFIFLNTYLLRRRILTPINRYVKYTQKIASGEYPQIAPIRFYRDEFSDLALAINLMVKELKLQQEILIQSHKIRAVGTLTAGVAHELNNPINNIMLTAYMLMEDYQTLSDEDRLDMIKDVIKETDRSKKIVANLLDFARESESKMEPLSIASVIKETLDLAANQINLKGAHIDLDIQSNLPLIQGDKQQMFQVFLNLIFNALDVTPKGERITIEVRHPAKSASIIIKISDHGTGIPDHIISSIFDPFFTTKAKQGGTGLGLSVTQGIVVKHGGDISVTSKINVGTTFTISLPLIPT